MAPVITRKAAFSARFGDPTARIVRPQIKAQFVAKLIRRAAKHLLAIFFEQFLMLGGALCTTNGGRRVMHGHRTADSLELAQ